MHLPSVGPFFAPRPRALFVMLATWLVLSLSQSACCDEGKPRFAPKHVAKLKSVVESRISPDGQFIAYGLAVQRQPNVEPDGPAWVELHVVDWEGNTRPFVTGKVNVSGIQWTPDGKRIAFTARRADDKASALYLIPIDGGEATKALEHPSGISSVAFHPDGKTVAFLATEEVDQGVRDARDKGFNQEIYEEDARPTLVWITELNSSESPRKLELKGSASSAKWHPHRNQLAVVLAPTPSVDDSYMFKRVSIVDADTGRTLDQVDNPGKLGQIDWSPDGKHLALLSAADLHDPAEGRLMVTAVPSDGELRDLMPKFDAHVSSFVWEDDDTLRWIADEGEFTTLGSVSLDGTVSYQIRKTGPILLGLSRATDRGTLAMIGHSPEYPTEIFGIEPNQTEAKKLTDHNPWLSSMRFARQEVIRWNARDGLDLGGVLVWPLDYEEGRAYPMIMAVHGGPEAHVANGWVTSYSNPGQVGAARGFVVFYPNYRGSTGRGVEFSKMGQADAAGKEFDDLVDGIDALVSRGLVQKDKVGITGGSYGGYASAWGSTFYSDRYAASVMFVGISDNVSKVGTTDIPEEMYLVHHRKRLWEDWDYFLKSSPIHYVERNKTPTLILHGKQDPRVHPSQSLELHRHLKTLHQAPVRLVLYEGEGHGNRKAAARLDYHLRLLQWMEHYLQGPGGAPPDHALDYEQALK